MEEIIKTLNYQPSGLTDAELENPLAVLTGFFNDIPLHDIRDHVWQMYKGWVTYSEDFVQEDHKTEMLFFYTRLIDVINASYIYTEMKKQESRSGD